MLAGLRPVFVEQLHHGFTVGGRVGDDGLVRLSAGAAPASVAGGQCQTKDEDEAQLPP